MDAVLALVLVILTLQLKEVNQLSRKISNIKETIIKNYETAKVALKNVFWNKGMRTFLIYRSLANHVAFLFVISLPLRVDA